MNSFGAPLTTPQPSFSFGSPAAAPVQSAFGAAPSTAFGAAPSTSFGAPAAQPSTGFGTALSSFGAPAAGSTGFGTSPNGGFKSLGSSFGAPAQTANSFNFGAAPAPATSSGFGASNAFGAPSTGFGGTTTTGFGSSAAGSAPSAFGSFNASAQQPASTFGSSATPGSGFGTALSSFGAPAAAGSTGFGTSPSGGFKSLGSSFGAPAQTTNSFNFGSAAAPTTSGFGSSSNVFGAPSTGFGSAGSLGGFGAAPTTGFGAAPTTGFGGGFGGFKGLGGFGQTQVAQQPDWAGAAKLREIQQLYAPSVDPATGRYLPSDGGAVNRACEFQTVMYRFRDGTSAGLGERKPEGMGLLRWEQMESDNPDPDLLAPVLEVGALALKRRFESQNVESQVLHSYAKDISESLHAIESSIVRSGSRLSDVRVKQTSLYNRLLATLSRLEVLRCRGVPLSDAEVRLYHRLSQMLTELQKPHKKLLALANTHAQFKRHRRAAEPVSIPDLQALKLTLQRQSNSIEALMTTLRYTSSSSLRIPLTSMLAFVL